MAGMWGTARGIPRGATQNRGTTIVWTQTPTSPGWLGYALYAVRILKLTLIHLDDLVNIIIHFSIFFFFICTQKIFD